MNRDVLLWQLVDLFRQYVWARQWWRVHEPDWTAYEDALEASR